MVQRFAVFSSAVCLLLLSSAGARATFACEVAEAPNGGVPLRVEASRTARVIRHLKNGAMVSLFDDDASKRYKGWSHVAHSAKGEKAWGLGDKGWIETRYLKDCG